MPMQPNFDHLPEYYHRYVKLVKEGDVVESLKKSGEACLALFQSIPEQKSTYKYAEGKWSINELLTHVIDTERVFAYRALSFARNDKTILPGFEENDWAQESRPNERSLALVVKEYEVTRQSTIALFSSFDEMMLNQTGTASGGLFSVTNLGFVIAGHEMHHCTVLKERYLS